MHDHNHSQECAHTHEHGVHDHGHDHHNHQHGHSHMHAHGVSGNIAVAFFLNLSFSLIEFAGGFLTNSIAIVSDAIHDLGDAMVIGISFFLERKSSKNVDAKHSFGYKRYSVLGALITTCVLIAGAILVIANAIPRLMSPQEANYDGMLLLAVFGIAVNGFAAWRTSAGHSLNQRAVNLHMLEDVLGWIAVLVGAAVMKATGWSVIDPILSICIAGFIGYNAVCNLRNALPIFLEQVPNDLDMEEIGRSIAEHVAGVESTHHLHIWALDEETTMATCHAVIASGYSHEEVKKDIRQFMRNSGIDHCTIETEFPDEDCSDSCLLCSNDDLGADIAAT